MPLTIERDDAPMGEGSLQWFVDADFEQHYFTLIEDDRWRPQLERICAFDLLVNNTDRKSGHCLLDGDGHIWAIDNGLSFHAEFKLRTVIWEFGGAPIPERDTRRRRRIARRRPARRREPLPRHVRTRRGADPRSCVGARGTLSDRRDRSPVSLAAGMTVAGANERLVDLADLDELVRQVDRLCDASEWDGLVDLRDRCRAALERGKQLWPAASLAEYRLALDAPGPWAGRVLAPGAGHLALGPLPEVAASTHTWDELAPHIETGPLRTITAHERVVRGEDLAGDERVDPRVLDLPAVLAEWEPHYPRRRVRARRGALSSATTAGAP